MNEIGIEHRSDHLDPKAILKKHILTEYTNDYENFEFYETSVLKAMVEYADRKQINNPFDRIQANGRN